MRSAPVVVDQVFRPNPCVHCSWTEPDAEKDAGPEIDPELESDKNRFLAQHLCRKCGLPQPLASGETYFSAFGFFRRFGIDREELGKRFYQVTRALHPDRFAGASQQAKSLSLQRMSFLNQAYSTLKSPAALRDYLLSLANVGGVKADLPMELAESWFELQDQKFGSEWNARLLEFENQLEKFKQAQNTEMARIERLYDDDPSQSHLVKLVKLNQLQNYIHSLRKDIRELREKKVNEAG